MPLKKYLDYDGLDYLIQRIPRTKIKVTFDDVFAGETTTCSMGTTTYTKTVPATEPYELVFPINELGTWTIATSYLGDDYGTTIEVTAIGQTATGHVSYVSEIDGSTVEPTDDITTWLKCANIEDPTVTTLADVLANQSLYETLIANSNACKYMARSTTWAGSSAGIVNSSDAMSLIGKYDYCANTLLSNATWCEAIVNSDYWESVCNGSVPKMTSDTAPEGECFSGSNYSASFPPYLAFDRTLSTYWLWGAIGTNNNYIGYKFPSARKVYAMKAIFSKEGNPTNVTLNIQGSVDGTSDYVSLASFDTSSWVVGDNEVFVLIENPSNYLSYRILANGVMLQGSGIGFSTKDIQFYGRASNEVFVIKSPIMTSNTAPSGECFGTGVYNNNTSYWNWFKSMSTDPNYYTCLLAKTGSPYWGYKFATPTVIKAIQFQEYGSSSIVGVGNLFNHGVLKGSNDNENWTTLLTINQTAESNKVYSYAFNNNTAYTYYKLDELTCTGTDYIQIGKNWKFGVSQAQTNIIHSAANDTIYMMENGSQVPLCTTNSDGDGILDFSQFMDGTYTLYSSVAKDPTNLSNDYSKSIRITKTSYGCTTEAYLMPDTIRTLYWFGRKDSNLEDCTSANGWSVSYSYVTVSIGGSPTYNTNAIRLSTSSNIIIGVGTKNKISTSQLNAIYEPITLSSASRIIATELKTSKYLTNQSDKYYHQGGSTTAPVNTKSLLTLEGSEIETYFEVDAWGGSVTDINALWYE